MKKQRKEYSGIIPIVFIVYREISLGCRMLNVCDGFTKSNMIGQERGDSNAESGRVTC